MLLFLLLSISAFTASYIGNVYEGRTGGAYYVFTRDKEKIIIYDAYYKNGGTDISSDDKSVIIFSDIVFYPKYRYTSRKSKIRENGKYYERTENTDFALNLSMKKFTTSRDNIKYTYKNKLNENNIKRIEQILNIRKK